MNYKPFYQTQSRAMRLWHWSTFIIIAFLLYSVFVGKFFLNPYNNSIIIHDRLRQLGFNNDPDPSYDIADALSKNVWNWHIRYGYVLTGLFLFRLLIEIFQKSDEKLIHRIKNAFFFTQKKEVRKTAWYYLIVRFIYLLFYFLLGIIISTGLWLSFYRHASDAGLVHSVKQVHESCFYFLLLFILIHIAGVIRAERREYKDIISSMINGGKEC